MIDTNLVVRDREIMSDTPVFAGTRVPIRNVFDYLEAGDTFDEFLDDFPTVIRSHAVAVLELCSEMVVSQGTTPHGR